MNDLQKLSDNVKRASDLIAKLRMDNAALKSEIDLLNSTLKDQALLKQQNNKLVNLTAKLKEKILKIQDRVNQALSQPSSTESVNHKEAV